MFGQSWAVWAAHFKFWAAYLEGVGLGSLGQLGQLISSFGQLIQGRIGLGSLGQFGQLISSFGQLI